MTGTGRKSAGNRQLNIVRDFVGLFFNYFKVNFEDEVKKNPVTGIKKLPQITRGNVAYTEKQIKLLKELMLQHNPRMWQFCEMVYESCTRPHEETRLLKVGDFDFYMNRLRIRAEISKEGYDE